MTGDHVDFQTGHFADFGQVKFDSSCLLLLTLGMSVILQSLGKMLGCKKQSKPSPFDKKVKNDT